MMNDASRNEAYQLAIRRAIGNRTNLQVLDLGCGAGLLSMMAARAGAERVTAVEATPDAPQFLHFGLLPGTEHTYSVSARNTLGVGGLSDELTAATANAVPATPLPPATDTVTDEASGAEELHVTITAVAYSGMLGLPLTNLSYEVEG